MASRACLPRGGRNRAMSVGQNAVAMDRRPAMRLPALLAFLAALAVGPALACAVPTSIEIRNEARQPVRQLMIEDDSPAPRIGPRANRLPPAGLAPGAAVTLTMPSCMGLYVVTAVFADGTEQRHPGIDAGRIRGLALR
jgi:hypothetical protein